MKAVFRRLCEFSLWEKKQSKSTQQTKRGKRAETMRARLTILFHSLTTVPKQADQKVGFANNQPNWNKPGGCHWFPEEEAMEWTHHSWRLKACLAQWLQQDCLHFTNAGTCSRWVNSYFWRKMALRREHTERIGEIVGHQLKVLLMKRKTLESQSLTFTVSMATHLRTIWMNQIRAQHPLKVIEDHSWQERQKRVGERQRESIIASLAIHFDIFGCYVGGVAALLLHQWAWQKELALQIRWQSQPIEPPQPVWMFQFVFVSMCLLWFLWEASGQCGAFQHPVAHTELHMQNHRKSKLLAILDNKLLLKMNVNEHIAFVAWADWVVDCKCLWLTVWEGVLRFSVTSYTNYIMELMYGILSTPDEQRQNLCWIKRDQTQSVNLVWRTSCGSCQRYDQMRMQLKTNRSIEDSVFVDIHKLGKHTGETLICQQ